ncbi:taste receptor type 2 member 39-like [Spea bombifrons]|uniref:taste receptor type 2 member 39-like n=1 Tax=Spea bombifrons TaxID=233779 RepID=UPI00234ABEDF|nr:taste receptor type 2 member 39-like [Spea bombifrons]
MSYSLVRAFPFGDKTAGMESPAVSPSSVACLTVLGFEAIVGIITNVFILSVILYGLYKRQNMSTSDTILVALCFSNASYAATTLATRLCDTFWLKIDAVQKKKNVLFGIALYSITCSSWLTACLCLFYFFKILNFRWAFLSWVKMKIDAVVPWLILVSEVVSVCSSASCMLPNEFRKASSNDLPRNISTDETSEIGNIGLTSLNFIFITICIPILTAVLTTFFTFRYLKLHSYRMRMNMGSRGGANLKAHQTAANTMIRLLVLYSMLYLSTFFYCFETFPQFSAGHWIILMILFSFTPVQSVLLILGNPKVKDALKKTLCSLRCSED